MRLLQVVTCTTFLAAAFNAPAAAATLSPPEQVEQAVDWFIGLFNNQAQVKSNPGIPLLAMENCAVTARGTEAAYVHLEQSFKSTGVLLRISAYEFSPTDTGVGLSVFSYRDRAAALGACDQAMPVLDLSNLTLPSCDLTLAYRPDEFFGTNAPVGCPSSFPMPGSTVVSTVTITADTVNSLDTFLLPTGGAIGTPIAFRRVSTPEPTTVLGLVTAGLAMVIGYRRV